jgi:fumarate hydratase class II
LAIGGTAVGTGLNCHPDFPGIVVRHLEKQTGIAWREARDHFEAQGAKDGLVQASGQVKTIAVSLFKIANDLRWLGSGPRCGIGELLLPETQPGSSIMPGKVNPVICESAMQVCARVIGTTRSLPGARRMEILARVMMPALAHSLRVLRLLATSSKSARSVSLGSGRAARCNELVEYSMAMVIARADHRLRPRCGDREEREPARRCGKFVASGKVLPPTN